MLALDPELWPMTKVGPDSPATFRKARLFVMLLDEGAEMGSCELHFLIDFSITDVGASSTRILGKHTLPSGWADLRWTGAMWSIRSFRILSAWHSKTGTRAGKQEHVFWCCIHVWSCVCVCVDTHSCWVHEVLGFASEVFHGSNILNVFDRICAVCVCVCVYVYACLLIFISTII